MTPGTRRLSRLSDYELGARVVAARVIMLDKVNGSPAHRAAEDTMNAYLDEIAHRMGFHEGE